MSWEVENKTNLALLNKALSGNAFSFIIAEYNIYTAVDNLIPHIQSTFPEKKIKQVLIYNNTYRNFVDELFREDNCIIIIPDFEYIYYNDEIAIGLNQRRDKLSQQKIKLLCFLDSNFEGIKNISKNIKDLWSIKNLHVQFKSEAYFQSNIFFDKINVLSQGVKTITENYVETQSKIEEYLDQLQEIENNENLKNDYTLKTRIWLSIAAYYIQIQKYDEALTFADLIYKYASKNNIKLDLSVSLNLYTIIYYEKGNFKKSIKYSTENVHLLNTLRTKNTDDTRHITQGIKYIVLSYEQLNKQQNNTYKREYEQAIFELYSIINANEYENKFNDVIFVNSELINIYLSRKNEKRAIECMNVAIKTTIENSDKIDDAEIEMLIAFSKFYYNNKNYSKALELLEIAEKIVTANQLKFEKLILYIHYPKGFIYADMRNYTLAKQSFEKALEIITKTNSPDIYNHLVSTINEKLNTFNTFN